MKKNNEIGVRYWKRGKIGHLKDKCSNGTMSEKSLESNATNVSLVVGDDDLL